MQDPAQFQAAARRLHELNAKATSLKVCGIALLWRRECRVEARCCPAALCSCVRRYL